jgi:DnaK suppressor protein
MATKKRKSTKKSVKGKTKVKKAAARALKASKKKVMPSKELKKYKELLIIERNKVGGDLSHIAQNTLNKSQREASGDLSGYSYHMADMASDDYERDFSLGRASDEQQVLFKIDEAMKRVDEGTYGRCLQCGKAIAKKRLKAIPYSEMCIECKKQNET